MTTAAVDMMRHGTMPLQTEETEMASWRVDFCAEGCTVFIAKRQDRFCSTNIFRACGEYAAHPDVSRLGNQRERLAARAQEAHG